MNCSSIATKDLTMNMPMVGLVAIGQSFVRGGRSIRDEERRKRVARVRKKRWLADRSGARSGERGLQESGEKRRLWAVAAPEAVVEEREQLG